MDKPGSDNFGNFGLSLQRDSDSAAAQRPSESTFHAFGTQNPSSTNRGSGSPSHSDASGHTGSSLSLDVARADPGPPQGTTAAAPVTLSSSAVAAAANNVFNSRRPVKSPSLNSASRLIHDQIMNQMTDNPIKARGHRRAHSEIIPTPGLGTGMDIDHHPHNHHGQGGNERDVEEALLSELMNFNNGQSEDAMHTSIGGGNLGMVMGSGMGLNPGNVLPKHFGLSMFASNAGMSGLSALAGLNHGAPQGGPSGGTGFHNRSISVDDGLLGAFHALSSGDAGNSPGSGDNGDRRGSRIGSDKSRYENIDELDGEEAVRRVLASNKKIQDGETIDPKRAKRILANRQSAARSKERKTRYISELEEKVAYYEKQATALKATLSLLQRETTSLAEVNEGMSKKMQLMEKLYRQREAENKQLLDEVEILRQAAGRMPMGSQSSNSAPGSMAAEQQMLALLQQQHHHHQLQQQQQNHQHQLQQQHQQHQQQQQHPHLLALQLALQSPNSTENFFNNSIGTLGNGPLNLLKHDGRP